MIEQLRLQEEEKKEKRKHLIKPGQKLPGAGRPKGAKNQVTLLKETILHNAEEKVLQEFMQIVETTIKLANQGDTTCLKILWDRIIPSKRAIDVNHTGSDKMNVVINISGLETKGIADVTIVDGEFTENGD